MNKFLLKVYINQKQYMIESNRRLVGFFFIFTDIKGFSKSSIFQRTKAVFFFFLKKKTVILQTILKFLTHFHRGTQK